MFLLLIIRFTGHQTITKTVTITCVYRGWWLSQVRAHIQEIKCNTLQLLITKLQTEQQYSINMLPTRKGKYEL